MAEDRRDQEVTDEEEEERHHAESAMNETIEHCVGGKRIKYTTANGETLEI